MLITIQEVLARAHEFDLIHSHLEWASVLLAKVSPVPVVTTFHGRLDLPWAEAHPARPAGGARGDQREPGIDRTPTCPGRRSSTTA